MKRAEGALVKITDLTAELGLSSRSLRYYEQVGLIRSVRLSHEKYRYYDAETVERLKQIVVLRKLRIPIKDILRIYESQDMSVVVETFVNRIRSIDDEIGALSELKRITSEFLEIMRKNGVRKMSALPFLYEEMEKKAVLLEGRKPVTYERLSDLSERLAKPAEPVIVFLPRMRVISSLLRASPGVSDVDGFWRWLQERNLTAAPGGHELFEYRTGAGDVIIRRISDDFENDSEYLDFAFDGGLFASVDVYLDDDLGSWFKSTVRYFDSSKFYMVDYTHSGALRHPVLLETLISPDDQRELVALLVPVKRRAADPALFDPPKEVKGISVAQIEAENPVLWEVDVPLDKLAPTHAGNSYFRVNEAGEAEYIGWITRAVLRTHVSVKVPFRIDLEFRQSGRGRTGVIFYCSEDVGYHAGSDTGDRSFGVNWGNDNERMEQAIHFHQPVFWNSFHLPGRGAIKIDEPNRVTWVVGKKHLAAIINHEVRYCGVEFPYMSLDLSREPALPIVIGAQGTDRICFRSIRISQLADTHKGKIKGGELSSVRYDGVNSRIRMA